MGVGNRAGNPWGWARATTGFGGSTSLGLVTRISVEAAKTTMQGPMRPLTLTAGMLERTPRAFLSPMIFKTVPPGDTNSLIYFPSACIGLGFTGLGTVLGHEPKLPMDITPRHSGGLGLAEKTNIFIILAPVVALSGKVLYN